MPSAKNPDKIMEIAPISGPILVSGAAGFVGRAVTQALGAAGCSVVVALRRSGAALPGAARAIDAGDLAAPTPAPCRCAEPCRLRLWESHR